MKKEKIIRVAPVIVSAAVLLVLWQIGFFHLIFSLKKYQLPVPSQILTAIHDNLSIIWENTQYTLIEALVGLVIGTVFGIIIAVFAAAFTKAGKSVLSIAASMNAIPMVAMAPIMNNWFGMGMGSKIAVVAFFSTSIMSVNVYNGLVDLKPFALDLMQSYAAKKRVVFMKCRLPSSLPNILTGLKIASSAALATAVCSEFFSSFAGIGFDMSTAIKQSKMPLAWGYIVSAAICGILMYIIIGIAEKCLLKWHDSQRKQ